MFSYYGTKTKLAKKYPKPMYDCIIEPFAGAARYSLLYCDRKVILNDLYTVIAGIWDYLIHCSVEDIKNLPRLEWNTNISKLDILQVEKDFLGFLASEGNASPKNYTSPWMKRYGVMERHVIRFLKYVPLIKHWEIYNKDYKELDNIEATWFIDPPYKNRGNYKEGADIDYNQLADWCKSRRGQVIVCENSDADWLPFKDLVNFHGQRTTRMESMCEMING